MFYKVFKKHGVETWAPRGSERTNLQLSFPRSSRAAPGLSDCCQCKRWIVTVRKHEETVINFQKRIAEQGSLSAIS